MIRPLLMTAGSRGDVEPLLALADGLTKSSSVDHTTLVIPGDLLHLAPKSSKLTVVALKFNLEDCLKLIPAFNDPENAAKIIAQQPGSELNAISTMISNLIIPDTRRIFDIAMKADVTVVISTFFTFPISGIVSEKLRIPSTSLILQPVYPSAYYPDILMYGDEAATAMVHLQQGHPELAFNESNLNTHSYAMKMIVEPILQDVNAERDYLDLPSVSTENFVKTHLSLAHTLISTQSQLAPRAPDFPPNVHIVGSLAAAYIPPSWTPTASQAALKRFIKEGAAPVVVTYGSMDEQGVGQKATRSLIRGLRAADVQRIVIVPGKAGLGLHLLDQANPADAELLSWAHERVFVTEGNVQYAWLFPQCSMVLCHCGAGTTSAALRAGIPVLGTPFIVDQIFYVEIIRRMKLGTRVGTVGLASITEDAVMRAVQIGFSEEVKGNTRAFAKEEKLRDENVTKACKLIENISLGVKNIC